MELFIRFILLDLFIDFDLLVIILLCLLCLLLCVEWVRMLREKSMIEKWTKDTENKVILHGMYGQNYVPTPVSPFVLKLETYLRMAKIDYELDNSSIMSPDNKTPWISINGEHFSDSQFIIEFLAKKYDKRFDTVYKDEQRAQATEVRLMMEEQVHWAAKLWRFKFGDSARDTFAKVRSAEITIGGWSIFNLAKVSKTLFAVFCGDGISHSEEEALKIMENGLRTVSNLLGNKQFLLGELPCEADCAIFAQLVSLISKDLPFQNVLNDEMKNLKDYCMRMKEEFYPDWKNWNELLNHR